MELRPYQQEAKNSIFEQWENGTKKTLLVLPTGCGKTIVFAKVTEQCVQNGDRVLILAHRGELLEQATDKISGSFASEGYQPPERHKNKEGDGHAQVPALRDRDGGGLERQGGWA